MPRSRIGYCSMIAELRKLLYRAAGVLFSGKAKPKIVDPSARRFGDLYRISATLTYGLSYRQEQCVIEVSCNEL